MQAFKNFNILLGSSSPRRFELLQKADIDFEKRIIEVEENYPANLKPTEVPEFLSRLKADAFDGKLKDNELLICADTIVIQDNKVIGKPKDKEEAFKTIQKLSDDWHSVVSGVCFKTSKKLHSFSQRSEVLLYPLSQEEIHYYIIKYQPFDKAGSYGIQDWIGITKIKRIEGSYSNIMGLPMGKTYHELMKFINNHDG